MSLEKASIVWKAKQLKGMIVNGKIDFNHIVQRSYVWEKSRKSAFIESMILGYPIPNVFAKRMDDDSSEKKNNIYYIMDGKQRLSTVKEYLCDEFALTELPPVTYYDDDTTEECTIDVSGKKYSELPESLQNHLATVTFNVTYFDNLTKEEERELFKRLNAGKPLSTKSRMLASCKDIEGMLDIGSHKLFTEMLTEKARDNKNQVTLVMKAWSMMNQKIEDVSFESKMFNPMIENTTITETEKLALIEVFNAVVDIHNVLIERKNKKIAKKLYTETHLISLIPFVKKSVEDGVDAEMMADWITSFFDTKDGASTSWCYNEAAGSGSAKNGNIFNRNYALSESYAEFFNVDDAEVADNEVEEEEETIDDAEESESLVDSIMNDMSGTEDEE